MTYKYSIIIPHYNDLIRLQRLLDSIPTSRKDIQVLVIDDCSPDKGQLQEVKSKISNVEWYSTKSNSGAGCARNIGLEHANGKFLVFADSDDEFTSDAFEIMDDATQVDLDLCYFLVEAVQESDLSPSNRAEPYNKLCTDFLNFNSDESLIKLKGGHIVPWAKLYSTKFILESGLHFDETFVSNDVAFNVLAAFETKKIKVIPKYAYRIYRRSDSLTSDISSDVFLTRLNIAAELATRLKKRKIPYRISITGALVKSTRHGPIVFFKVLRMAVTSDMEFNVLRIFNIMRWYRYYYRNLITRRELNKINK